METTDGVDDGKHDPRPEFKAELDAATPARSDFVLYCRACEWIGEKNAAHARSSVCPECRDHTIRIWKHTTRGGST